MFVRLRNLGTGNGMDLVDRGDGESQKSFGESG